jgi:hypothetical protein
MLHECARRVTDSLRQHDSFVTVTSMNARYCFSMIYGNAGTFLQENITAGPTPLQRHM